MGGNNIDICGWINGVIIFILLNDSLPNLYLIFPLIIILLHKEKTLHFVKVLYFNLW
ncbi:hypothetical protein Xentx_00574 [Xenorhabdus thuongxuanensis]|uniref:Uncharacterized protein n=1 Tax=Xenorhabdus thuongxuanensis TaxID=1873484 RepID=A0A1Q5U7C2_9GAMM|nr:hypothetical protein Xentx_00574 [Xenorhabdus thuongxuanensis]